MIKDFANMIEDVKKMPPMRLAVVQGADTLVLESIKTAKDEGIITPILIGDKIKIKEQARKINLSLAAIEIIDVKDISSMASTGAKLIFENKADILMKGMISTAPFVRAVLDPSYSLVERRLISHLSVFNTPAYGKMLFITDAGINISPTLEEKCIILQNSIDILNTLGYKKPKIAVLTAVETVSPKMPACIDAAIISKMAERKQITGAFIDGPLALDNAINKEAAQQKGITSQVAGDADLLLVPNIETGNTLAKSITYLAGGDMAGVLVGAKAPIVVASRADSSKTKFLSIVLACKIAGSNT